MTAVEQRRSLYRDLVLAAAEREFARVGFTDAKVTAIAAGAGVSLATVYKAFPSKVDIWNDLHTERMTALLRRVDLGIAGQQSPLERLVSGIGSVARFLTEHDAYLELNLGASTGWLAARESHGTQGTVWSSGLATITAGVEAARAADELADLRPRIAAGLVVSALQVWLSDWVESGRDRSPDELVHDLVAHLRIVLSPT